MKSGKVVPVEERTARLTVLIDPRKKVVFEKVCAAEDVTPSQVVRRLIRAYIEKRTGHPWAPGDPLGDSPSAKRPTRRRA